jgi:hypothetical protein
MFTNQMGERVGRLTSFWVPSTGEEAVLNFVAASFVLLLLAFGFDILKLPANIAPNRPPLVQAIGLMALIFLNLVLFWTVAREDYLRFAYGFPRVIKTFVLVSLLASGAILTRGWWDKTYLIDPNLPLDVRGVITVAIAGQFVAMAFCATYLLKKTDTAKVREFKKNYKAAQDFIDAMIGQRLTGPDFEEEFARVGPDIASLSESARAARLALDPFEAAQAEKIGVQANKFVSLVGNVPTAAIVDTFKGYLEHEREMLKTLVGRDELLTMKDPPNVEMGQSAVVLRRSGRH